MNYQPNLEVLEKWLFDKAGFKRLHIAGHPEGSKDIDPDGSMKNVSAALSWKQAFSNRTDASMAITTQFCFDAQTVKQWADNIKLNGIDFCRKSIDYADEHIEGDFICGNITNRLPYEDNTFNVIICI